MKKLLLISILTVSIITGGYSMNLFNNVNFNKDSFFRRKISETEHHLIMQIGLVPGQSVPQHPANSFVKVIVLEGTITVVLENETIQLKKGDIAPVEYKTKMEIKNLSEENALFIVIKTPHPDSFLKK
jgi:quercetin dioxygenase-like cupin family protein